MLSKRKMASDAQDERITRWKEKFINKRLSNVKAPVSDIKVYIVNGEAVRDFYSSDYSQGGNPARYPWIPDDEVWIEDRFTDKEIEYIVRHECEELVRMQKGMSYGDAHDEAKAIEDQMRHRDVMESEQAQIGVCEDPTYHGKTERDKIA